MRKLHHLDIHAKRRARNPSTPSWVEVDLTAIHHNVRMIRKLIGDNCQIWAVIKADAYGHGAVPVARAALEAGVSGFTVATYQEAIQLRRAGIRGNILLLSAGEPGKAKQIVQHNITQAICHPGMIRPLAEAAHPQNRTAEVHLKIDSGFGRLGVRPDEAAHVAALICQEPGLRLTGVCTHLSTTEGVSAAYSEKQFACFQRAVAEMAKLGINPGIRHVTNSAGTLRFPHMRLDGVRLGLLIYGIIPNAPGIQILNLHPALAWKTRIAFVQQLPAGSAISYDCTYMTPEACTIGVLPLGYADGYPRHASNRAHVLVRGQTCPVIGRVCMCHVIVDLTRAGDVSPGDEVTLIGRQGNHQVTANDLARWAETCVHEITTVIGPRVARSYHYKPDLSDTAMSQKG